MWTIGLAAGVGLSACLAHVLYARTGVSTLLTSAASRGRLGASSVEVIYVGGTVLIAGVSGIVVLGTSEPPRSELDAGPGWLSYVLIGGLVAALVLTPDPRSREPSRLRRLLLCLGGAGEEVIWRGVAVSALVLAGIAVPWAYMIAAVGFSALHVPRYGRRGMAFILLFSLAVSVLAWTFGLVAAIAVHVTWNASMARRRPRSSRPSGREQVSRAPVDEW